MTSTANTITTGSPASSNRRALDGRKGELAQILVRWLENAVRPEDLLAAVAFGDLTFPHWRIQTRTADELFAVREGAGHLGEHDIRVERLDPTGSGFLLQFEERWTSGGQRWYAREMIHAVVEDGLVAELILYCTGDWDEETQRRHAAEVTLLRA